jgi:glycosyltransferase involved in cell wall biosynthesis/SAM-dependent methyltransferase
MRDTTKPGFEDIVTKPRIVFFVTGLSVGGAERHTVDLRARLRERGFDTNLLVFGPKSSQTIAELPGAEDPEMLNIVGMSRPWGWVRAWRAIRKLDPDLIVCVNQTPLIVAGVLRFLRLIRSKVVGVFHTTLMRKNEESRVFLFRWAANRADCFVFISANQRRYWEGRGIACARTALILNGIDLNRFVPRPDLRAQTREKLGFSEKDVVFGLVATFRSEKNHFQLIDALDRLRQNAIPAKVLFVGHGPTHDEVRLKVEARGLSEHVVFAGEQSDVTPWVAACDVGVLCSNAVETFSLAAIEFLASGIPMVMSDIGGASEIVREGENGFLFEADNLEQLVEKLKSIAQPDRLAHAKAVSRPSILGLSVERMVDEYATLFETLEDQEPVLRPDYRFIQAWSKDQRTPDRIIAHYKIERELADRLRQSSQSERQDLYQVVYSELFARLPDHPQNTASRDAHGQRVAQQVRYLTPWLNANSTYVEIGCGDAALNFALAPLVKRSVGVDVTAKLIEQAKAPANFEFVHSDGSRIPMPDGSVDVVYSNQVMEHIHTEDVAAQLAETARILRPGGLFFCATPSRAIGPTDVSKYFDDVPTGFHMKEYDFSEMRSLFRQAGFESVQFAIAGRGRIFARPPYFLIRAVERLTLALPSLLRRRLAPLLRPVLGINAIARR